MRPRRRSPGDLRREPVPQGDQVGADALEAGMGLGPHVELGRRPLHPQRHAGAHRHRIAVHATGRLSRAAPLTHLACAGAGRGCHPKGRSTLVKAIPGRGVQLYGPEAADYTTSPRRRPVVLAKNLQQRPVRGVRVKGSRLLLKDVVADHGSTEAAERASRGSLTSLHDGLAAALR